MESTYTCTIFVHCEPLLILLISFCLMGVFSHSNFRSVKTFRPFVFGSELAFFPLDDAGRCVYLVYLRLPSA